MDVDDILVHPERVFAAPEDGDETHRLLGEMISPLVIEADGAVVPVQYGFVRDYGLGMLGEASLAELAARWRAERASAFHDLCRGVLDELSTEGSPQFVNWYEAVTRAALAARQV
jgi:hypothetical protein